MKKLFLLFGFSLWMLLLPLVSFASYENAILLCGDNEFLAGNDGVLTCKSAADIVSDAGGFTVDTDNQTIDVLNLDGTTLEISLEDDGEATYTLNLAALQDGDDQTIAEVLTEGNTAADAQKLKIDTIEARDIDGLLLSEATNNNGLFIEDTTGFLGVNVLDPTHQLHVFATTATPQLLLSDNNGEGDNDGWEFWGGEDLQIRDNDSNTSRFFIEGGASGLGNIGIGTNIPDTKLEILNAGNQLKLSYDTSNDTVFATSATGDLTITPSDATTPTVTIAGQIQITGGTPGASQVLTSDGSGLATWEPVPADGDGDSSNEGSLTVLAGAANTSVIQSNTSGSTDITLSGGSDIDITESGNTITIASSFTEADPTIGTLENAKWCSSDGSNITCTEDAPAAGISGSGTNNTVVLWNGTDALDASGVTETELNILDGATLSTAELNLLDLSGLTTGHVLRATGATNAAWGAILDADLPATIARDSELHDVVTLGTANGLSLSTQELSLALADTDTTGALSDTDWDTFNNKQEAIIAQGTHISSGSISNNTFNLCNATAGPITLTLPAASSNAQIIVKKIDSSANACTIDADGSETIDGNGTRALSAQWVSIHIFSDGSNWYIK